MSYLWRVISQAHGTGSSRETLMCLLSDGDLISISMKHPHCALQKKKKKKKNCYVITQVKNFSNTNYTQPLNIYILVFSIAIYSCDDKPEYSALLLQSSVSHPSQIILICWFGACSRNIYYYQYWKHLLFVLLNISVETMMHFFQDSLKNTKFQRTVFILNINIISLLSCLIYSC